MAEHTREVGGNRPKRTFLGAGLIDATGTGIFLVLAPIVAVQDLRQEVSTVALAYTAGGIAAVVGSLPLAHASDRFGQARFLLGLHVVRCLLVLCFPFATHPVRYVAVVSGLAALDGPVSSLHQAIAVALNGPKGAPQLLAQLRTLRNLGFAVGSLASAAILLLEAGSALLAALINALSFSAAALMYVPLASVRDTVPHETPPSVARRPWMALAQLRLWLGLLSGALSVHTTILTLGLALWVSQSGVVPKSAVGLAVFANAVVVILCQVPVSAWWGRRRAQFWLSAISIAFAFAALAFGLRYEATATAAFVVAVVGATAGELLHSTASWSAAVLLSRTASRSRDIATFNLGTQLQEVIAPVGLAWLFLSDSDLAWGVVVMGMMSFGVLLDVALRKRRDRL